MNAGGKNGCHNLNGRSHCGVGSNSFISLTGVSEMAACQFPKSNYSNQLGIG
jgi:hypothetical protein